MNTDRNNTVCRVTVEYLPPQPDVLRITRTGGREPMRPTTMPPVSRIVTLVDALGPYATVRITLRPAEPVEASSESAPATAPAEPAPVAVQSPVDGICS